MPCLPLMEKCKSSLSLKICPFIQLTPLLGCRIDVIAKKHDGGRGQAFIVFEQQVAATSAMRGLNGQMFYNKELRITYAKTQSHATLARQDPAASREAAAIKAAKLTVSRAQDEYEQLEKERHDEEAGLAGEKRPLEDGADEEGRGKRIKNDEEMDIEIEEGEYRIQKKGELVEADAPYLEEE
nr:hypothetical protein L204_03569 [Cryptococcus depauperatus CBS 7855]